MSRETQVSPDQVRRVLKYFVGLHDRSRYQARKTRLREEGGDGYVAALTPSERVSLVWRLTVEAWTFKDGQWDDAQRLRRDVVRTVRRRG